MIMPEDFLATILAHKKVEIAQLRAQPQQRTQQLVDTSVAGSSRVTSRRRSMTGRSASATTRRIVTGPRIGRSASATTRRTVIGSSASATTRRIVIGSSASATTRRIVTGPRIGRSASATTRRTMIGSSASATTRRIVTGPRIGHSKVTASSNVTTRSRVSASSGLPASSNVTGRSARAATRSRVTGRSAGATRVNSKDSNKHPTKRGFIKALALGVEQQGFAIIAELKKASPSAGVLSENYVPVTIANDYARAGAHCLSVLTDKHYFQGHSDHLKAARLAMTLPILRKDFLIDESQLEQSASIGADAVLLIAAAFKTSQRLAELVQCCTDLDLDILLEIHNSEEWYGVEFLAERPNIVFGINNRSLHTFEIDLGVSETLAQDIAKLSPNPVISESGIRSSADIRRLRKAGASAFLVGSHLMAAAKKDVALRDLIEDG